MQCVHLIKAGTMPAVCLPTFLHVVCLEVDGKHQVAAAGVLIHVGGKGAAVLLALLQHGCDIMQPGHWLYAQPRDKQPLWALLDVQLVTWWASTRRGCCWLTI